MTAVQHTQNPRGQKNLWRILLTFIAPSGIILVALGWFFLSLRPVSAGNNQSQTVMIEAGTSIQDIARLLKARGLIRSEVTFTLGATLSGVRRSLQAGEYSLSPAMSATEIARTLAKNIGPKELVITIPEGWTSKDMSTALEERGIVPAEEFLAAVAATDSRSILPSESFDFLASKPITASLEGFLFPDTYRVFERTSAAEIIRRMLKNFDRKISPLRSDIAASGQTLFDLVTMASIVEREVQRDEDRKLVADIFWRRLTAGIALQADSTLTFLTGKKNPRASAEDLALESPYNTYQHRGLPPGPISNPGFSSIAAALRPTTNEYFYFLTDPSGSVHYARTFAEHVENKRLYLP